MRQLVATVDNYILPVTQNQMRLLECRNMHQISFYLDNPVKFSNATAKLAVPNSVCAEINVFLKIVSAALLHLITSMV